MECVYGTYIAKLIIHPFPFIAYNDIPCTMNLESYAAWICVSCLEHHGWYGSLSYLKILLGNEIVY